MVDEGKVDFGKLLIDGGFVGGFVVLVVMIFYKVFSVGISFYGVFDFEVLVKDIYKFESRYLDILVGLYFEDK